MDNGFRILSLNTSTEARLTKAVLASYNIESRLVDQNETQLEVQASDLLRIYEILPDQRPPQEFKPLSALIPKRKQWWRDFARTLTLGLLKKEDPLLPAPDSLDRKENELR